MQNFLLTSKKIHLSSKKKKQDQKPTTAKAKKNTDKNQQKQPTKVKMSFQNAEVVQIVQQKIFMC